MPSTYSYPPADSDIAALVKQLTTSLENMPTVLKHFDQSMQEGATLGALRGITAAELQALYNIACTLCNDGAFEHALPISLQLMLHAPADSRYTFQAGSCLQRLGEFKHAAILFARTLDLKSDEAAAAYRLGECLLTIDRLVEAKALFEMAIELSRGKFHCRDLYELAEARILSLQH